MTKAVARNPICLAAAAVGSLSQDLDLATLAIGQQIYSWSSLFGDPPDGGDSFPTDNQREFLYSVAAKAREKVVAFEGFMHFCFGLVDDPGPNCALPMLIGDKQDERQLQRADFVAFVGVPSGDEVGRLRAASLNLLFMCVPDPENLSMYCMPTPGQVYCGPERMGLL